MKYFFVVISLLVINPIYCQSHFIELNGGEKIHVTSLELIQEKYEKPYLKSDKGDIYTIDQISSFQNDDGYFILNTLTKNRNDFAKRVLNGRIAIYKYDLTANYIQTGQNNSRDYFAYQKYDSPLKQMIYENLIVDLSNNPESMRVLNKIKRAKNISPFYYVFGGVCILTSGVLFNTNQSDLTTPLFLTGVGFFSIPWIINAKRQKRMQDAIKIYNAG